MYLTTKHSDDISVPTLSSTSVILSSTSIILIRRTGTICVGLWRYCSVCVVDICILMFELLTTHIVCSHRSIVRSLMITLLTAHRMNQSEHPCSLIRYYIAFRSFISHVHSCIRPGQYDGIMGCYS